MSEYTVLASAGLSPRAILDLLSVRQGLRPRSLIQVPAQDVARIESVLDQLGLTVEATRHLHGLNDPATGEVLLYPEGMPEASTTSTWSELWVKVSALPLAPAALFDDPARYLGYPACCVSAYAEKRGVAHLYRAYLSGKVTGWPEINRLAAFFTPVLPIPDYFPCSLGCTTARNHVLPLLRFAQTVMPAETFMASWRVMQAAFILDRNRLLACPVVRREGAILHAEASTVQAVALPGELLDGVSGDDGPRMLPFSHWRGIEGVQLHGVAGVTPRIPQAAR